MGRFAVVLLSMFAVVGGFPAASAAPSPSDQDEKPPPAHADRDRDGLSDDLEHDLAGRRANERVDVVVTFDGPGDAASSQRAVGRFRVVREFEIVRGFAANMAVGQARALAKRSEVFRVEPDFPVTVQNGAANADFGAAAARSDFGVDGVGIEVCVVDTGVDPGHEQLDSKAPVAFYDAINGGSAAYDDHGHGTHVAASAVGDGTGSSGASVHRGVAPGASLSAAKVLDAQGLGSESQVVAGVDWCAQRASVDVISMSLGSASSSDGEDAISQAVNAAVTDFGKVAVVAAGNSGDAPSSVGSPAAAASAITVGAAAEWSSGATLGANASRGVHLAPWSSRGPTADGRTKPDVVAPGMTITSARHGTTSGYVTWSGTSMATPFTSGTVALMLDAGAAPADIKSLLTGTAVDWGTAGQDNDWGHGVLDGYAAVAQSAGGTGQTGFPTHTFVSDSVADHGLWTYAFEVTDAGAPIAATLLVDGSWRCSSRIFGSCWLYEWTGADLDVRLKDPSGTVIDQSVCPLYCHSGSIGRQETIEVMPTATGTYSLEVYPYEGDPNYGAGGPFTLDLSHGPAGTTGGGGGGGTINSAPTADGVTETTTEDTPVTLTVSGSDAETCELAFSVVSGPSSGALSGVTDETCTSGTSGSPHTDRATLTYTPDPDWHGSDSFTYRVSDGELTADATVSITVSSANDAPPVASFTFSCTDLTCDFADTSSDADGPIVSWSWDYGDGSASTAQHPRHIYASGDTYTVALTVTDSDGATNTTSQSVTVTEPEPSSITLSAVGSKQRGIKYADLTWSGATVTSVDVYRDGNHVITTLNGGAYTDNAGRGGGSHTYKVCSAGTTTCSNEATVNF